MLFGIPPNFSSHQVWTLACNSCLTVFNIQGELGNRILYPPGHCPICQTHIKLGCFKSGTDRDYGISCSSYHVISFPVIADT